MVRRRRRPAGLLAAERLDDLRITVGTDACAVWLDNYSRQRYSRNPNEQRNDCVNGTAFAVLPLRHQLRDWDGWPALSDIYEAIPQTCQTLMTASKEFSNNIRAFLLDNLGYADVRVPCDRRRTNVTALDWFPHSVEGFNIGSAEGLVMAMEKVLDLADPKPNLTPFLADVNVYYRVLKLAYSASHNDSNVRGGPVLDPGLLRPLARVRPLCPAGASHVPHLLVRPGVWQPLPLGIQRRPQGVQLPQGLHPGVHGGGHVPPPRSTLQCRRWVGDRPPTFCPRQCPVPAG